MLPEPVRTGEVVQQKLVSQKDVTFQERLKQGRNALLSPSLLHVPQGQLIVTSCV